jgi:D-lactate dehydrogenase
MSRPVEDVRPPSRIDGGSPLPPAASLDRPDSLDDLGEGDRGPPTPLDENTLQASLAAVLPSERVLTRTIDRIAFANDASVYRLVPQAVVQPASIDEVQGIFRFSHANRIPLTFRAAGTSLSGQAVTDGILVDVARHWGGVWVEDGGARVRFQPGVIAAVVNRALAPYQAKIGPDPASINACMMGGVLANNSSGMCCGIEFNAYQTLDSMVFVLPDGTVVDTSAADAEDRFAQQSPHIARGLLQLKDRIEADTVLRDRIRHKYRMKNTMGYSLNAFLDYERPVEILSHLMIGSEGTLGFIADAVLCTVPDYPLKHTGLLFFPDVPAACSAIVPLRDSGARTLELMDRASLRSVEDKPGVPEKIRSFGPTAAALLVEYQSFTEMELGDFTKNCVDLMPALPMDSDPIFTRDSRQQAALWSIRKGLIPSVGAQRQRGTSMIIEDVAFPLESLADGVGELQRLLNRHSYDDAIIFGHAKDGNLHFVLNQSFGEERDVARFDSFLRELADMVAVRYDGALKAEHSTGRNMTPFLQTEWGPDAVAIMRELKALIDPERLLNPDVLINDNPNAHATDLKSLETVEDEVDPCIECGFCERLCPSRNLSLTPRQRIVVRREMARLRREDPGSAELKALEHDYQYSALDTCASDGMCATGCPVDIDTGQLVKRLRDEGHPKWRQRLAVTMAKHFGAVERIARTGLRVTGASRTLGLKWVPSDLPGVASRLPRSPRDAEGAIYVPSCVTRVLGPAKGLRTVADVVLDVCTRAGSPVWIPAEVHDHCCGMPFASKGYHRAYVESVSRMIEALWDWSDGGEIPIVIDTSPCAYTLRNCGPDLHPTLRNCGPDLHPELREQYEKLRILDSIEYAVETVVPSLEVRHRQGDVVLHPVCSAVKMELEEAMRRVTEPFAAKVIIPESTGCCGFAGDRGYLVPELTAAATETVADEIREGAFEGFYSSSRTCEIGMTRATSKPYRSFWYLLDEATK